MHRARIARTLTLALAATAASAGVAGAQENVGQAGVAPAGAPAGADGRGEARLRQTGGRGAEPVGCWSALGDTTLTRLIRGGLEANRQVDAAEARIASARAMRTEAALNLAPTITADAAYSRQR